MIATQRASMGDGEFATPARRRRFRIATAVMLALTALGATLLPTQAAQAQENPLEPLDSSSPQATYLSFTEHVILLEELLLAYERNRTKANQEAFSTALAKVEELFNLSEVSSSNRGEIEVVAFSSLADILNRLPLPDINEMPDAEDIEASTQTELRSGDDGEGPTLRAAGVTSYTLPGTEITIALVEEGPRAGSYLFSVATVAQLDTWRAEVDGLPVNEVVVVRDWVRQEKNFTGHLVPRSLVDALPDAFDRDFLGTPIWKVIVDVLIIAFVGFICWLWHRLIGRRGTPGTTTGYLYRLSTPIVALSLTGIARVFMNEQVNHSGDIATVANLFGTFVIWGSMAWAFWIVARLIVEWIIATPTISDESVDAHLLRLLAKVVSVAGAVVIAWIGLSRLGISTVGLGVGAGVLGLALALAATSTLENLLGGITVYADKPFAVDDMIRIAGHFGTVEEIGPRSTRVRLLDDTRVMLPNADVSRATITNYSKRNHILFKHLIGVRYETTVDQLTTIVEALDARLREHPMVLDEDEFPRVRVFGYGDSSINIEIRAHIDTEEFYEYTIVQQELLFLIYEIVEATGTGFAFPSTTAYLAEDTGLPEPIDSEVLRTSTTVVQQPASVPIAGDDEEDTDISEGAED